MKYTKKTTEKCTTSQRVDRGRKHGENYGKIHVEKYERMRGTTNDKKYDKYWYHDTARKDENSVLMYMLVYLNLHVPCALGFLL